MKKGIKLFSIITISVIASTLFYIDQRSLSYANAGMHINSISELKKEEAYAYANNRTIYEFIYNDKCSDCLSIENSVTKKIKYLSKFSTVLMINTDNIELVSYIREKSIRMTPAIIIKRNHKIVTIYQGTNNKIWSRLLDPQWTKVGEK